MTKAAKKKLVKEILYMDSIQISFVVYRATETSDFCHYRLIVLSTAVSFIPMATTRLLILITTS